MKAWRVWFGEHAVLVNAETKIEAEREAFRAIGAVDRPEAGDFLHSSPAFCAITKIECLTLETKT